MQLLSIDWEIPDTPYRKFTVADWQKLQGFFFFLYPCTPLSGMWWCNEDGWRTCTPWKTLWRCSCPHTLGGGRTECCWVTGLLAAGHYHTSHHEQQPEGRGSSEIMAGGDFKSSKMGEVGGEREWSPTFPVWWNLLIQSDGKWWRL